MLLGSRLEALLRLNDLRVCDGLCAQLDLDLLQLLTLAHDALQALLQDVLAEAPAPVDGDGAEVVQSPGTFLQGRAPETVTHGGNQPAAREIEERKKMSAILGVPRVSEQAHSTHLVDGSVLRLAQLPVVRGVLNSKQQQGLCE